MIRIRAGIIVLRGGKILLMYRRKDGREYYIIPGGGAGTGETAEAAAVREAKEETGFTVEIERKLFEEHNNTLDHYVFLARPTEGSPSRISGETWEGEPVLGGEEALLHCDADFYELRWVPLKDLPGLDLRTPETKSLLLQALGITAETGLI